MTHERKDIPFCFGVTDQVVHEHFVFSEHFHGVEFVRVVFLDQKHFSEASFSQKAKNAKRVRPNSFRLLYQSGRVPFAFQKLKRLYFACCLLQFFFVVLLDFDLHQFHLSSFFLFKLSLLFFFSESSPPKPKRKKTNSSQKKEQNEQWAFQIQSDEFQSQFGSYSIFFRD